MEINQTSGIKMMQLYSWPTPNGHKVHIMLEECELSYRLYPINIREGDQFRPEFSAVAPNQKIPVLVDSCGPEGQPICVFESGAILLYLSEKAGRLLPTSPRGRYEAVQWLMFQMSAVGPMFGQSNHFRYACGESIPYAIERYGNEVRRIHGVLDRALASRTYLASDEYSIADIAVYPWLVSSEKHGIDWSDYPNLRRWLEVIGQRPAVQKGMSVFSA
ncbi:glutathione S-transferase N-terminal domain-containing protein [Trinickia terrae]|nr:glutathione S-transferase N-terminal domain-containing protein [Trinickia terrae]